MQRVRILPLLLLTILTSRGQADSTALDRYIAAPDPAYSWKLISSIPSGDHTAYVLEMTSQSWLSEKEVDKPIWKHWLTIIKPKAVNTNKSLVFVTGGSNNRPAPKAAPANLVELAVGTNSVVSELRGVPSQPITFAGEDKGRSEDSLIAYSWDKFLRSGDEKWPARLPMTKAVVRAMDTVTAFCASVDGGALKVDQFVVSGASKRGWTTWAAAAVDKRVIAIIPIVIDVLNVQPSFIHHFRAYGFYAPAVKDYTRMNIPDWAGTPEYARLLKIEDPYEYRDRLTMPKFMINATGDQFFLPDSSQFYFDQLSGPKYLRYVPNADHSLKNSDAAQTMLACYHAVLNGVTPPRFEWKLQADGSIAVSVQNKPREVLLWQATNEKTRDFRIETLGPKWTSTKLSAATDNRYLAKVEAPPHGWTAFFAELTFDSGGPAPFKFTTPVRVLPETLPHEFHPPKRPQ